MHKRLKIHIDVPFMNFPAICEDAPGILFYVAVEPDGVFRFLSVTNAFLVATGLTREQVVGSLVRDVIPPASREMVLDHYREAVRSGQTVRWEEESVYPAGRRYGEVAVTPLSDSSGVVTQLVGIVHDITKRKRLEVELRAAHDTLERRVSDRTAELEARNTQLRRLASELVLAEQRARRSRQDSPRPFSAAALQCDVESRPGSDEARPPGRSGGITAAGAPLDRGSDRGRPYIECGPVFTQIA